MNMYSGLLPPGLTEADLSSEEDADVKAEDRGETKINEHRSCQTDTETHLSSNVTDLQTDPVEDDCPPGVSPDKWQRFKDLQKAKDDQRVMQPQRKRQRKRRHKKGGTSTQNCNTQQNRKLEEERKDNWKELKQYFGINDRLKPPPCYRPPPLVTMISVIFRCHTVGVLIPQKKDPSSSLCSMPTVCETHNCFLYQT